MEQALGGQGVEKGTMFYAQMSYKKTMEMRRELGKFMLIGESPTSPLYSCFLFLSLSKIKIRAKTFYGQP